MAATGGTFAWLWLFVVMLPIYLSLLGGPTVAATFTLLYTLAIAVLMVSQVPVFSGKRVGKRIEPEMVLPVFVVVVSFLSVVGAEHWHRLLSGLPAARLGVLQGVSAQGRGQRGADRNDIRDGGAAASPGRARASGPAQLARPNDGTCDHASRHPRSPRRRAA